MGLERETREKRSALESVPDGASHLVSGPAFIHAANHITWATISE